MIFALIFFTIPWRCLGTLSPFWVHRSFDESALQVPPETMFSLQTDKRSACALGTVKLAWSTDHSTAIQHMLALKAQNRDHMATKYLVDPTGQNTSRIIKCAINEDHCMPVIKDIIALTENSDMPKLQFVFAEPVNRPSMISTSLVLDALVFSPPVIGSIIGDWIDELRLEVVIDPRYLEEILDGHRRGVPMRISPRRDDVFPSTSGSTNIRMTEMGKFQFFILDSITLQVVSNVIEVDVLSCEDATVAPSLLSDGNNNVRERQRPSATIRLKGIIPMRGSRAVLSIPDESLAAMVRL